MKSNDYIAVAINRLSGVKEYNPYFWRHLTMIAPDRTIVTSLTPGDEGFKDIKGIKIQLNQRRQNQIPPLLNKFRFLWNIISTGYYDPIPVSELNRIAAVLKKYNVKKLLAEEGPVGCALQPLCDTVGIQLFVHFHGHDATAAAQSWYIRHAYKKLFKKAHGIIATSNYLSDKLEDIGLRKIHTQIIPCGVDTKVFKPDFSNKDEKLVIAVGRLIPKKAPHYTISAFAKALQSIPNLRLEMIGDGPMLELCKSRAIDLGIDNKVIFSTENCGNDYVRRRLQQAAIFCQHSVVAPDKDTESFGISLIEAMACEIPVVATRHNGFTETVAEGLTGFLVDEYDADGMANKIIKLAQ